MKSVTIAAHSPSELAVPQWPEARIVHVAVGLVMTILLASCRSDEVTVLRHAETDLLREAVPLMDSAFDRFRVGEFVVGVQSGVVVGGGLAPSLLLFGERELPEVTVQEASLLLDDATIVLPLQPMELQRTQPVNALVGFVQFGRVEHLAFERMREDGDGAAVLRCTLQVGDVTRTLEFPLEVLVRRTWTGGV